MSEGYVGRHFSSENRFETPTEATARDLSNEATMRPQLALPHRLNDSLATQTQVLWGDAPTKHSESTDKTTATDDDTMGVAPQQKSYELKLQNVNTSLEKPNCEKDTKANSRMDNYPVVVFLDGRWTEISCNVCGRNALYDTQLEIFRYFSGVQGLINHVKTHITAPDSGKDSNEVSELFKRRIVSDEDVQLMERGETPNIQIEMRHTSTKQALGKTRANTALSGKRKEVEEDSSDSDIPPPRRKTRKTAAAATQKNKALWRRCPQDWEDCDDEEELPKRERFMS